MRTGGLATRKAATAVETAASRAKWDEVKAWAGNLGKAGQTAIQLREKAEDGTFRLKPGN